MISLPEDLWWPNKKYFKNIDELFKIASCDLNSSRIFMNNPEKESTPRPPDSHVVHWLNAINPDLFSERAIRYVKYFHRTIHQPSHRTYAMASSHTHTHTHTGMLHTSTHCIQKHVCLCVLQSHAVRADVLPHLATAQGFKLELLW